MNATMVLANGTCATMVPATANACATTADQRWVRVPLLRAAACRREGGTSGGQGRA